MTALNDQNKTPYVPISGGAHAAKKQKKKPWWLLIVVLVLLAAAVAVSFWWSDASKRRQEEVSVPEATKTTMQVDDVTPTVARVKNPIDFKALKKKNPDLYAWIKMPNTVIDYPIAQSAPDEEEDFYLHHGEDKEYLFEGTIYTQKCNSKDFSDPNTILYGHCMKNGTMFRALHDLKVQSVWDATPEFTIYTEGHILTYRIFSAYTRDDRHILVQNDFFKDKAVFADYLEAAAHPTYGMTRECNLTTDDRIVTLETCVTADGNTRFIVSGVLTNDQPTY